LVVLKITRFSQTGRKLILKLEGEIRAPWVETVRDACTDRRVGRKRLRLDLAAVSYVDAAGVRLLQSLRREGIEIAACSNFIGELLDERVPSNNLS
jgi:anti-anti-sigma factor